METKDVLLAGIERLMNELVGFWIDSLGSSTRTRMSIRKDLNGMCPGVTWKWVKDHHGRLTRIKVIDFEITPPASPGAVA